MAAPTVGLATVTPPAPGTPVNALGAALLGGYVVNPIDALDILYVDPTGPASTLGSGTTIGLRPGQTFFAIPNSTLPVSVASKQPSHNFVSIQWIS